MTQLHIGLLAVWVRAAKFVLPIAFVTFMWAGLRYNSELSTMTMRSVSSCAALAPKFVEVSVKGTLKCVETGAAHRFMQAALIAQVALGICFLFFLPLLISQKPWKKNAQN
jgi:uncharacterized membrane protein YhdT